MRPTTDLFDLVHSMSESERQIFARTIRQRGTEDAIIVRLFDAMARMSEYDEQALIDAIDHEPLRRGFASYKHHLYATVLRFVAAQDAELPLPSLLITSQNVEALVDRGLYHQAWRQLKRAIADATQIDAFDVHWRLLQQERNIVMIRQERHFTDESMADALGRIDASIEHLDLRLQQVNALRRVQRLLTTMPRDAAPSPHVHLHELLAQAMGPADAQYSSCNSTTARMLWHHVHILYYGKVERNPDVVYSHAVQLLDMLEETTQVAQAFAMHLMRAAATFATASTWVGNMDGVRRAIDVLRNAPERYAFRRTAAMQTLTLQGYTYQAVLLDETLDFEHIDAFLEECQHALALFAPSGRRQFADELRLYVAKLALITHRLPVVHAAAAEILRHKSPSTAPMRIFMRQVTCIAALLVQDYDSVESIASSALRNAKAESTPPVLVSFFRTSIRYCSELDTSQRKVLLESHLQSSFEAINDEHPHDVESERKAPHIVWARSVLDGRSFVDAYCDIMRPEAQPSAQAQ